MLEHGEVKLTKLRIKKNLILIALAFFLLFTAYDGLSMLQSTMNKKDGVGVLSQAVGYISFCVSAMLFPKYMIKKLGCKSTLLLSIGLYIPFIAANFYPKWYVMIPTAVFGGLGAATLWGSQCTYYNESAVRYAKLILEDSDIASNRTTIDYVPEKGTQSLRKEDKFVKNDSQIKDQMQLNDLNHGVVKYTCENSDCENVDEFNISEIPLNNVEYIQISGGRNEEKTEQKSEEDNKEVKESSIVSVENKEKSTENSQSGNTTNQQKEMADLTKTLGEISCLYKKQQNYNAISEKVVFKEPDHELISNQNKKKNSLSPDPTAVLESVTGFFFGFHGLSYFLAQICSNVISYSVLNNYEDVISSDCVCGAEYCNGEVECLDNDSEIVSNRLRYILTGISTGIAVVGALAIFLFVDPLRKAKTKEEQNEPVKLSFNLIFATFSHCAKKEQLCLIPMSFYEGMVQGFYTADFTESYVACAWGASHVGLVSVFYGTACVFSTSISGFLVKYAGRKPLFLIGQGISIAMITFLLLWNPDSSTPYKFYLGAICFGTLTGIYWSQLLSFYGLLFKEDEEAAFSSYYLFSSIGWTISFLYSDHLCTYIKLYILLSVSFAGTTGYFFTERWYGLRKKEVNASSL